MWFGIVFGFGIFVGALIVLGIEAIVVLAVIERLSQKSPRLDSRNDQLDHNQSLDFSFNKQGILWVLLSSKVPKDWLDNGKAPKEQKRKNYFEVTPVKKKAKINGQTLVLTESDGSKSILKLKGCTIETVSASHLSSRKWAKRLPLKLENKVSPVYKECKTLYIFLETSWEKESWCKALRLASSDNRSRLEWSVKLQKEFRNYLTSLNDGYPSFMKPSSGLYATELLDRTQRNDGSSKVRTLWKKLAKKASKNGADNRASWPSLSYVEKMGENGLSIGLSKNPSPAESARRHVEDSDVVLPKLTHSMSQGQASCVSDADTEERFGIIDEGTLCWNLLISRLFFDSKKNGEMKKSLQARIQRTMSNMRTPSYIREVICTDIDLGNLPPYIHGMRVLPMDTNEVWAFELDVEYAGSLVLSIETRLEVRELDSERTLVDPDSESNSVEDVPSELLEGFEDLGKQLDLAEGTTGGSEHNEEGEHKLDRSKSSKASSTYRSRWKSIVNNIANQVSQVPISMAVRISSLRGTLRIHIKPPPSDQLWFGFTSMPDIDFNLDSAIGDHKITNGQIALFIINRLKGAINETLVLPNCECVGIPFMLAEKDDWVPRKVAPFIWVHRDTPNDSANSSDHLCEAKPKTEQAKEEATRQVVQSVSEPSESKPLLSKGTLEDLKERLLVASNNEEESEGSESHKVAGDSPDCQSTSRSLVFFDKPPLAVKDDAAKPKKMGTRERMFEYRKKVSDKLEEKRRQMEEKSKQLVEKMRGT